MKKVSDMSKVSEKDRKLLSHVFAIGGAAMMLGFAPEKLGCGVKGFGNSADDFKKKIKNIVGVLHMHHCLSRGIK